MKYYFFNANVLSQGEIFKGSVIVENNKITYVGKELPNVQADRKIDVKDNILMSGFVNAHSHSPMTLLRGLSDDVSLHVWLYDNMFKAESKMTPEDVYYGEMLGIAEQVRNGITCIEECYFYNDQILKALKKSGMRCRLALPGVFDGEIKDILKTLDKTISEMDGELIRPVVYGHSIYTLTDEQIAILVDYSAKHKLPMSLHLAETLKEVGDCTVKYDKTPAELLEDLGVFDRKTTLYHCVHMDKDDIKILSDYDVNVVTCPSSNLKLGSGIAPVFAMRNQGVNVCLGTDGAASNNSLDMFKEMFLVATLNKATLYDASILKANEVLDMATKNGAKALGYDNLGDIVEGNLADLILINLDTPHQMPRINLISNLVYATKSSDVYFTMINGKVVYEDGKFNIGEDLADIYKNVQKISNRICEF